MSICVDLRRVSPHFLSDVSRYRPPCSTAQNRQADVKAVKYWMNESLLGVSLSAAEGSGEPELCPAGTFSPVPGLTSEAGCQPCTAGFYCREAGLTAPTGPCSRGQCMYFVGVHWCFTTVCSLPFSKSRSFVLLQPPNTVLYFPSTWQATGALLVRQGLQLCRVRQATSVHRVVHPQRSVHQEPIRTERNRQPAMSVRQVWSPLYSFYHFKRNTFFFISSVTQFCAILHLLVQAVKTSP